MVWGYLDQFWDAVTETVVGGVTYTVDWFQQIGNAVAGAVGNLFDSIIHSITDLFVLLGWTGQLLSDIFSAVLAPLSFIYNFFQAFWSSLFSEPITPIFTLPGAEYIAVVPGLSVITGVLSIGLVLYLTFTTIKHLTHI